MSDIDLKYGFRYDPIPWIENDDSVWAALARLNFLNKPRDGDGGIIDTFIAACLAKTPTDWGPLSTGIAIGGLPLDNERLRQRIVEVLDVRADAGDRIGGNGIRLACGIGWEKEGALAREIQALIDGPVDPHADTPGLPEDILTAFSAIRKAGNASPDMQKTADAWLDALAKGANKAGCWKDLDPLGICYGAASMDGPVTRELFLRYLPMLLRTQRPDGDWHAATSLICCALRKHGLFEALRELPPLPPDWRIAEVIPLPEEDFLTTTWANGLFWLAAPEKQEVVAISPVAGAVVKRIPTPPEELKGIGWYEDKLVVITAAHGGTVMLLDPETGEVDGEHRVSLPWHMCGGGALQVGEELWLGHGCWIPIINPGTGAQRRVDGYGPWPCDLALEGDTVWLTDGMHTWLMYHWGTDGDPIEVVDAPFTKGAGGERTMGIAHDGKSLWAFDEKDHRICRMERTTATAE